MSTKILENHTIRLRALEPDDLDLLYRWENDAAIWYLSNTLTPFSKYTLSQYIQSASQDIYEAKQLRMIIEEKTDNKAVGAIDLFDFDPYHLRAGIGILISEKENRKKGYASEALETLKKYCFTVLLLHQLYCNITEDNTESLRLFINHGFVITGQKKEWIRTAGGWLTEYFLQLTES